MNLELAIRLLRETCALRHTALNTEKSYIGCLRHYAAFLKSPQPKPLVSTEEKIEAFLTKVALTGVSVSTQNQAFNALLFFYRYALKQELGNINALRAKRPAALRYCPAREETLQLLTHVTDLHGYPLNPTTPARRSANRQSTCTADLYRLTAPLRGEIRKVCEASLPVEEAIAAKE